MKQARLAQQLKRVRDLCEAADAQHSAAAAKVFVGLAVERVRAVADELERETRGTRCQMISLQEELDRR